jgi:exodeoxyribonuclease V alpha subunit
MEFLGKHELPYQLGLPLFRRYGQLALDAVRFNPYLLVADPYGVAFSVADGLAISLEISAEDPRRVEAGLLFELAHNLSNGHSFLPRGKLLDAAARLIGVEPGPLERGLQALSDGGQLVCEAVSGEDACYLAELYAAEQEVADRLLALLNDRPDPPKQLKKLIRQSEAEQEISLAPLQRQAVELAARHPFLLLTGGPGTGKTASVRAILALFDALGLETALAAPTGRAAKRMSELCFREAQTIHRLLEAGYHNGDGALSFARNADNLLPADAVIVDEASMVDILLMRALLDALKPGCRLILVGDAHQLPSVGPGNLVSDLMRCGRIPTVELTEIFRQAQESAIVMNAHRVNRGETPDLNNQQADFFFLRRRDEEKTVETILELCRTRLPERMGIDPGQIQVLSPTRLHTAGTRNLNRLLQEKLNPASAQRRERRFGDAVFREGDRVIQTRNNYDIFWQSTDKIRSGYGIFNGDVGYILHVDVPGETITVEFDDRRADYTPNLLGELELAYAMTVHKAQGSEYRAVILAAAEAPRRLLSRSVLYTAITRARELLILVGDDDVIARMAANNRQQRRYSGLRYRLSNGEQK